MRDRFFAKDVISAFLIAALILPAPGCATLKNTKMPSQFLSLGICPACRQVIAADGLSDDEIAVCPECSSTFLVRDARYRFKKKCIDLKNRKSAIGFLTVALMAASVAGTIYGIPVPFPPVFEDTFTPYKLPAMISCRRAAKVLPGGLADYARTPDFRPAGPYSDLLMPRPLDNQYGIYESPYSMVIMDRFYDMGALQIDAPYEISLGRIDSDRYDLGFEKLFRKMV